MPLAASHHLADVAHDQRAAGQAAEVDGLEMGEQRVVALDREHGLHRRDLVALVERVHLERVPVAAAELEDRDRLVDPAQHRLALLEHLHRHARVAVALLEQAAREVEVGVRVVAGRDALGGEAKDARIQPRPAAGLGGHDLNGTSRSPGLLFYAGAASTRRISASAARPTSSCSGAGLARAHHALDLVTRAAQQARERRGGMALAPGEHLHGEGGAAQPHRGVGGRPAQAGAARGQVAERGRGEHRRHQVRAAAVVLLGGLGGVGVLLVGRDRLVLHAVVGGQLAAAQGHQRGGQAQQRDGGLAAGAGRRALGARGAHALADGGAADCRRAHHAQRLHVLHRQARLGQRPLHQRDHRQRLGQLDHAAHAGHALGALGAEVRLAAGGHLDLACVGAHRGGPVRGAVHEQPVAQRHAAQPQLVFRNRCRHRSVSSMSSA